MVIVTLIRHGETEHNAEARLQGWSESELSGLGRRQACLTGRVLSQRVPKVERIWTSDLCRCLDTSKIMAQELGSDNQSLIRSTSLLREASYGALEGMKVSDAIKRLRREGKTWQDYGESIKDVEARLAQAWTTIMDEVNESGMLHVVVVTHGSVISMVARFLVQRLNFTLAPSIAGDRLRPPRNASLSVLNINSSLNFGSIERYGDDEHLQRDPDHQRS